MDPTALPLITRRLRLDGLRPDDADALFACRSHPEVARFQGWRPTALAEAVDFVARQQGRAFGTPDTWFQLAIRRDGALVGDLGVHFPATVREAVELGVSLHPDHQRQGLAAEAMGAVLDRVLGPMGYRRVVGSVDPRNTASAALLRSLGFRQEAHHVQSVWLHGEWVDDVIFALLAAEWADRAGGRA